MSLFKNILILVLIIKVVLGQYDTLEECQSACQDNNACTTQWCVWYGQYYCSTSTNTCNDSSVCTNDYCDPKNGTCINTPALNCDDNDPCTEDTCHFYFGCVHKTKPCDVLVACNKDSDCYRGRNCETYVCNTSNHICSYTAKPCTDELPCLENLGTCVGSPTN